MIVVLKLELQNVHVCVLQLGDFRWCILHCRVLHSVYCINSLVSVYVRRCCILLVRCILCIFGACAARLDTWSPESTCQNLPHFCPQFASLLPHFCPEFAKLLVKNFSRKYVTRLVKNLMFVNKTFHNLALSHTICKQTFGG